MTKRLVFSLALLGLCLLAASPVVQPAQAQIVQCPGGIYGSVVTYYSDSTRTVKIGQCETFCNGEQVCEGSKSTYVRFARYCCSN